MSTLVVHRFSGSDPAFADAWDAFVNVQDCAGPMHWSAWHAILSEAFAVEPYFLAVLNELGQVFGVAPFYFSTSIFEGSHLATLQDGILAMNSSVAQLLLRAALTEAKQRDIDLVVVRGGVPIGVGPHETFSVVHTVIDTSRSHEFLLASLKKKVRWEIRQCRDLIFEETLDSFKKLEQFHSIFSDHQRRLGTPAFGQGYFAAVFHHLGNKARLFTLEREGAMVGGMVVVRTSGGWSSLYAAMDEGARKGDGGYFLYWKVIEWMCLQGVSEFDLGRSTPEGGVHRFKTKWGGRDIEKVYCLFGSRAAKQIAETSRMRNGQTLKQRAWRRLPKFVCRIIGPKLRRQLPVG